jgi:hypothetical protein
LIRRIFALIVALAAMATAAGVIVVAAAYALFALVRDSLGPSGAAAVVCAAAAVLILLLALVAYAQFRHKPAKRPAPGARSGGLAERVAEAVRERPAAAAGVAAAAGLLAWRNPQVASILLHLFDPAAKRGRRS